VGRWVDQLPCGGRRRGPWAVAVLFIVVALIAGKLGCENGIIICGRERVREALGFLEYLRGYLRYWLLLTMVVR
jgi:hypothetical protein